MSTGPVQAIFFPQGVSPPRLVAITFKLKEVEKESGPPDMLPSVPVTGEVERVLLMGQAAGTPGEQEYHTIAPRMAGIDSDQLYLMYWMAGGSAVNASLFLLTEGQLDRGLTGNVVVLKMSPVWDVWQDADLEADLPILKRYLTWFHIPAHRFQERMRSTMRPP